MNAVSVAAVSICVAAAVGCGSVPETPSDCTAPCAGDPVDDFDRDFQIVDVAGEPHE